jgi:hypothetical protein
MRRAARFNSNAQMQREFGAALLGQPDRLFAACGNAVAGWRIRTPRCLLLLCAFTVSALLALAPGSPSSSAESNVHKTLSSVSDNFNRSDESPLSDGGNWGNSIIGGTNEIGLKVVSNQLATSHTTTSTGWRNDQRLEADTETWVTIAVKPGNGNVVRVYARLQAPGTSSVTGYMIFFVDNSGTDQVSIDRISGGTITTLTTLNQEFNAGDGLKIRVIGSSVQAWRNDGTAWSELGEVTDSTNVGAGYSGVGLRGTTGRLDNFGAQSLAEPPVPDPLAIDTFNRADETPLSDAGNWGNSIIGGTNEIGLKVVSNQLATSHTTTSTGWWKYQQFGADADAWVTIVGKPGNGNAVRVYARLQAPGTSSVTGYMILFVDNSGTDQVSIDRISGTTITALTTLNQEFNAGDKLRIRVLGSRIQAWRYDGTQWSELGEVTNSTYGGAGYTGVGLRGTIGRLDDFAAANDDGDGVPTSTGPVSVVGDAVVGNALSFVGSWSGAPYSQSEQWYRCSSAGDSCVPIPGATAPTYVPTNSDIGHALEMSVATTNLFGSSTEQSLPTGPVVSSALLVTYAPELRLDSSETYFADSAAEMTDYHGSDGTNQLYDSSGAARAAADGSLGVSELLSLSFLGGDEYGDFALPPPSSDDKIDAVDNYASDYQETLHLVPGYANKVYGRVYQSGGLTTLQYWFFYYNNPFSVAGIGKHEGDWEGIQILLGSSGPVSATYDQHGGGETCDWSQTPTTGGTHPVVYVANGSHASYFWPGSHPIGPGSLASDSADGHLSPPEDPAILDLAEAPSWLSWPGHWGGSTGGSLGQEASPTGPSQKGAQWDDPITWGMSQNSCTTSPGPRALLRGQKHAQLSYAASTSALPPIPRLRATIRGLSVVIRFRFASWPASASRHPWVLFTSVVSADPRIARLSKQTALRGPTGTVVMPRGAGPAPLHVVFTVLSKGYTRTPPKSVLVRSTG